MLNTGAGNKHRAARLIGAFGGAHWPLKGFQLGPDLATIRARFERDPFAAEVATGRVLSVDRALDQAPADTPRTLTRTYLRPASTRSLR